MYPVSIRGRTCSGAHPPPMLTHFDARNHDSYDEPGRWVFCVGGNLSSVNICPLPLSLPFLFSIYLLIIVQPPLFGSVKGRRSFNTETAPDR